MEQPIADVTLIDLVANNTLDERIAALLWTVAEEKRSIVTAAEPRKAGKSTVLHAALQHIPDGTPVHTLSGPIEEIRDFAKVPNGGYLEVGEISSESPERYIWGEPVLALFEAIDAGFSLATTMHAADVNDLFSQICGDNKVPDKSASVIEYVVYIRRFGDDDENYWRRVNTVHEIHGVTNGAPSATPLFSWREKDDSFIELDAPARLNASSALLSERADLIKQKAAESRSSKD